MSGALAIWAAVTSACGTDGTAAGNALRQKISDATGCDPATSVEQATVGKIVEYFAKQDKTVVTFVGYSGAGYENEAAMRTVAEGVLEEFDPAETIVNIGATPDGIGAVYELAAQRGFPTSGIVSTQAREYGARLSDCVDQVFYVEDETWGGLIDDGQRLSPTSEAMVKVSDLLVGIGGGEVARDELLSARRDGRAVRFIPAEMSHSVARAKAKRHGLPEPTDFGGAASKAFPGTNDKRP